MTMLLRMSRKALTAGVIFATVLWSLMASALIAPSDASAAGCVSGTLIKGSLPAVYYCGADGKRYVFTNDKAFFTWYADFSSVVILSDAALGEIPIGGNVTYRPGKKMIKIQSDPRVYVINRGGVLRHVPDEQCAVTLYGSNWNKQIDDVSDSFFVNYQVGSPLATCSDFDKNGEMNVSVSINVDKALTNSGAIVLPAVSSVTPAAGATNVAIDSDISATFSKKMKASTLSEGTFTLMASASGSTAVAGTVSYSGQTATFNPSASLAANTAYRATLTTGVKDEDDRGLSVEYSWTFTTGAAVSAAPTVSAVTPAANATNVAVGTDVTATFSAAMDASTLTTSTFTLTKSGSSSAAVTGTVSYSGTTATFNPSADLETGATYTAKVTTGAKTPGGTGLSADYSWSFTTGTVAGPVSVTAISPPDGGTNVAIATPISATFSGAMNASTITTETFKVMRGSTTAVPGTVSLVGNVATFTPTSPLMAGATYTVTITSEAKSASGQSISGGTFFWSFTTAS